MQAPAQDQERSEQAQQASSSTLLAAVRAQSEHLVADGEPGFVPALITDSRPQGEQGMDMSARPVHAGPFEPGLHDELIGALHTA